MLQEIDSATAAKHYAEKLWKECGGDVETYLRACFEQIKASRPSSEFARACDVANSTSRAVLTPEPTPQRAEPSDEPAARSAAAPASPSAGPDPEEAAEELSGSKTEDRSPPSSGLKPNAGNGLDLDTYSWTQSLAEVSVSIPLPLGTRGKACQVSIGRQRLSAGLRGAAPVLEGALHAAVLPDESTWTVTQGSAGAMLEITLVKSSNMAWWPTVVEGGPSVDTSAVEPENSKLEDLDPDMRQTVEKMMFDQRQKAMGLPTSEEQSRQKMLQSFMAAHPEMDFSKAKIGGMGL